MATPSPTAQANPQSGKAAQIASALGVSIQPNSQQGGTKADKYGLGAWGQANINTTGLFDTGSMTTDDAMKQFLQYSQDSSKVGVVAAIQQALYMSGNYYSSTYQYVPGVVRPEDQRAFAKFLTQNAQTQDGVDVTQQKPLAAVLQDNAQRGVAFGVNAATPAAQKVYTLPAEADLEASAMGAAQSVLGRKATKAEAAAFAAYYRHIVTNYQQTTDGTKAQAKADAAAAKAAGLPASPTPVGPGGPSMLQHQMGDGSPINGTPPTPGTAEERYAIDSGAQAPAVVPQSTDPAAFMQHIGEIANVASQTNAASQSPLAPLQVEQPPSPGTAAEDYMRNNNPGEAGASDIANTFNSFLKIISGKLV